MNVEPALVEVDSGCGGASDRGPPRYRLCLSILGWRKTLTVLFMIVLRAVSNMLRKEMRDMDKWTYDYLRE